MVRAAAAAGGAARDAADGRPHPAAAGAGGDVSPRGSPRRGGAHSPRWGGVQLCSPCSPPRSQSGPSPAALPSGVVPLTDGLHSSFGTDSEMMPHSTMSVHGGMWSEGLATQQARALFTVSGGFSASLGEMYSFPHRADCVRCAKMGVWRQLKAQEQKWGSGMCDNCYDATKGMCTECDAPIPLKQMHWETRLCDDCYDHVKVVRTSGGAAPGGPPGIILRTRDRGKTAAVRWRDGTESDVACDELVFVASGAPCFCRHCGEPIRLKQMQWETRLCDPCYDKAKVARRGGGQPGIILRDAESGAANAVVRWLDGTEEDVAVDELVFAASGEPAQLPLSRRRASVSLPPKKEQPLHRGVLAAVAGQFVFYMAPAAMQPALYLHIAASPFAGGHPTRVYAAALTTASVVMMLAPWPLGAWAERRGEREVYTGVAVAGAAAGLGLVLARDAAPFAICWGMLCAPPAIRGVRAAFFARRVPPDELTRAGQLATTAGLAGGLTGPAAAALLDASFVYSFVAAAAFAAGAHVLCAISLARWLPRREKGAGSGDRSAGGAGGPARCDQKDCRKVLTEQNGGGFGMSLCNDCYDKYGGEQVNFRRYLRIVLCAACVVAFLLELSMNATVIALLQPVVVHRFGWGAVDIAKLNICTALLSIFVAGVTAAVRLPARSLAVAAAGLYVSGVLLFTVPPLSPLRVIVGVMLGMKAQVLFMSPFTAVFSLLIGRARVTNRITTILCTAPAVGGALGNLAGPYLFPLAGTWWFPAAALPALAAFAALLSSWPHMDAVTRPPLRAAQPRRESRRAR